MASAISNDNTNRTNNNHATPTTLVSPLVQPQASPLPAASPSSTSESQPAPTPDARRPDVVVTQSSVLPSPQTIPTDPSTWDSSSTGGGSDSRNSRSLPLVAILFIAIVAGLIGLVILYRIYRRVFGKIQLYYQRRQGSSPLPPPPPSPPPVASTSRLLPSTYHGSFASSGARLSHYPQHLHDTGGHDPSSYYHNDLATHQSSEHLDSLVPGPSTLPKNASQEKYEGESYSSHSIPSRDLDRSSPPRHIPQRNSSTQFASEDGRPLLFSATPSRTSSPSRVSGLNPLLMTRDHSTLSTNTLKKASRHQSMHIAQQHRFSLYEGGMATVANASHSSSSVTLAPPASSSVRNSHRMSSGLPHLTKSRIGLTLPPPLAYPYANGAAPDSSPSCPPSQVGSTGSIADRYREPRASFRTLPGPSFVPSSSSRDGYSLSHQQGGGSGGSELGDEGNSRGRISSTQPESSGYRTSPYVTQSSSDSSPSTDQPHSFGRLQPRPSPDSASPLDVLQMKLAEQKHAI